MIIRSSSATRYPRRFYLPSGSRSLLLNAGDSDGSLGCGKKCGPFGERVLTESCAKSPLRHPDEPMRIWRQLRRLWMRLLAIEHLRNSLAFIRCQSRYVDQRLNSLVGARRYHRAGISVRYKTTGPSVRSRARSSEAMSSDKDVNGIGGARTFSPLDSNGPIMSFQLEPSAHAP